MAPFSYSGRGENSADDMEKQLNAFVDGGLARKPADISSIKEEHRDWLYGEDGQLTQEGLAVERYMAALAAAGVMSHEQRWEWATIAIERDLLMKLREYSKDVPPQSGREAGMPQANLALALEAVSAMQLNEPDEWTVRALTMRDGRRGRLVRVGPFSAWIPEGDTAKAEACVTAMIEVFRSKVCEELVAAIRSEYVS